MRLRPLMSKLKPSASPRCWMFCRLASVCAGVTPYFCARCSSISWPSGAIFGFSSKGWKCSLGLQLGQAFERLLQRLRPMTHQGQGNVGNEIDLHDGDGSNFSGV